MFNYRVERNCRVRAIFIYCTCSHFFVVFFSFLRRFQLHLLVFKPAIHKIIQPAWAGKRTLRGQNPMVNHPGTTFLHIFEVCRLSFRPKVSPPGCNGNRQELPALSLLISLILKSKLSKILTGESLALLTEREVRPKILQIVCSSVTR